jgi:hypothetical protein
MILMTRPYTSLELVPGAFAANGFPLLEFDRKPIDRDLLRGFALAWSAELTLVQVMCDKMFRLNGYAVFRNSDVRRWRAVSRDDFLARAAVLHRVRPCKPGVVTIASMKEAVVSAGATFPLITIHRERTERGCCYVGKMLRASQRAMTLLHISTQAQWEGEEESYPLRDITLLEFGGAYEKLLARMAKR